MTYDEWLKAARESTAYFNKNGYHKGSLAEKQVEWVASLKPGDKVFLCRFRGPHVVAKEEHILKDCYFDKFGIIAEYEENRIGVIPFEETINENDYIQNGNYAKPLIVK